MEEKDIITLLINNGGKEKTGKSDVKVQYNKNDITAIFRKSACEKLNVEKIPSLHFTDVKALQKALDAIKEKNGVTLTLA